MPSEKYFKRENIAVFYKMLTLIFNADEYVSDGSISEAEKETLSNFLRMFSQYREEDAEFQRILSARSEPLDAIVAQLKAIDDEDILFYYMLQAYALCAVDSINIIEEEILSSIVEGVLKNERAVKIIHDLFAEKNRENADILFIGNDSSTCDIVKSRDDISACIIQFKDEYYLLTDRTQGLLRINNKVIFDHIIYTIDINDKLFINNEAVGLADLMLRFELKHNDGHIMFYMVKKAMKSGVSYAIVPYDAEPVGEVIGLITVRRSHISVMNNNPSVNIVAGGHEVTGEVFTGCIDDKILIDDHFMFDLSSDLASIVFSNAITSKIIKNKEITIGNDRTCDVYLPLRMPKNRISKLLLKFYKAKKWVLYITEAHAHVSVNNVPVKKRRSIVRNGDVIEIAGNYIVFDPENNNISLLKNKIHTVRANEMYFRFKDGRHGITRVMFENNNKDFCCIMGPSGSGKSTLVKILTGYRRPMDSASLKFNNFPFYENYGAFKNYIGYVSQDDVLFEHLTVYENLFHYGRLKAPETDVAELNRKIGTILTDLGMSDKKDQIVGSPEDRVLSGGERKRLNIGLELITDTSVLVLDEPTSGLSSFDTIKIIDLLSFIANTGKIVYVVIHQPSLDVFLKFTHLILLDRGGHLAYFGRTRAALDYFSRFRFTNQPVHTPDDMLETLEAVKSTPDGETIYEYDSRNNRIPMRIKTPKQWSDEFYTRKVTAAAQTEEVAAEENILPEEADVTMRERLLKFVHLFLRNFKNKFRDRSSTILSFLIPSVLALFLSSVLRYQEGTEPYTLAANNNIPKFLFLTSIIFIFLAISNAISEILKDRLYLEKERLIGYSALEYLISKLITLALTNCYQILLYLFISFSILGIPIILSFAGVVFFKLFLSVFILSFAASMSATAMALFISSFLKSEKAAFLAVPLLIIPQIIFGGMFLNFSELRMLNIIAKKRPVPVLCNVIHARWMYEGYLNAMRYDNPDKVQFFQTEEFERKFGSFNNQEVVDIFRSYNLSSARNQTIKEREDKTLTDDMQEFTDAVRSAQEGTLSPMQFLALDFKGNINYFPYYRKILYPFVIPTYTYDLIALFVLFAVFFTITALKLERDRK